VLIGWFKQVEWYHSILKLPNAADSHTQEGQKLQV